jgi:hypothetical protein
VNLVVQPLGQHEELGVARDHPPAAGDLQILDVAEEDLQHLRDTAADSGRADVPDGPVAEAFFELPRGLEQPGQPLGADNRS